MMEEDESQKPKPVFGMKGTAPSAAPATTMREPDPLPTLTEMAPPPPSFEEEKHVAIAQLEEQLHVEERVENVLPDEPLQEIEVQQEQQEQLPEEAVVEPEPSIVKAKKFFRTDRVDIIEDEMASRVIHEPASLARADGQPVSRGIHKAAQPIDLGVLMPLMKDDTISDVLINGPGPIYVERKGLLEQTRLSFKTNEEINDFAKRIMDILGRTIDDKRPLIDARLPDGSRVNIIMPPMAVDGTTISIRKFPAHKITLDTMRESGVMPDGICDFLKACAKAKINLIISGGTGAGKTTMLNSLSHYISDKERIVTIEDSAELQLQQPHVVRLESKRPDRQGNKEDEVNIRDLVINSLRMRPDRIIVGEVRGGEAFDMLQAMNTGHEGSMATLHANTPRDALSRLENMINMADLHLGQKFIRQQIVSALTIIVQVNRFRDGSRRITHITEVVGLENDVIVMQDLFIFKVTGEDDNGKVLGQFEFCNVIPRCKELSEAARKAGVFTSNKIK